MKRRIASLALATTLFTALMVSLGAGPAAAAPTGCWAGGGYTYTNAYCSGGNGYYKAVAVCKQTFWPYYSAFVESDWKRAGSGQTETKWCPLGYNVMTRWVGLRN